MQIRTHFHNVYAQPMLALLAQHGYDLNNELITGPINVQRVLSKLGYAIIRMPLYDVDSQVDDQTIFLNADAPLTRQRFELAHILGQYIWQCVLSEQPIPEHSTPLTASAEELLFTNKFATQFLMPAKLVHQVVADLIDSNHLNPDHLSINDISDLSDTVATVFAVSKPAAKLRLDALHLFQPLQDWYLWKWGC